MRDPACATYSEALADALAEVMAVDERVVAITPAMLEGSALTGLKERFPTRVFDVGIAEQHAVTFSAGLAAEGLRPVCVVYSTFLQRAVDQVIHDVCLPNLPVIFAVDRAGLVGADGATHQGAYDLSMLRSVPNLALAAPVWGEDLPPLLETALAAAGPTLLRFPRGTLPPPPPAELAAVAPLSGARWLRRVERPELTVWALGPLALAALEAAGESAWNVVDARYVKPLDLVALREAAGAGALLTVEEGAAGGMGASVLEALAAEKLVCRVRCKTLPDAFVKHGDARVQRAALGLDSAGIRQAALELLEDG